MVSILIGVFLPCYYGTELTAMSDKLSECFFHSDWFEEDQKYRNSSKIFMEFVLQPEQIYTVDIFEVNLENFINICNFAYSLFAVLKKIKSQN